MRIYTDVVACSVAGRGEMLRTTAILRAHRYEQGTEMVRRWYGDDATRTRVQCRDGKPGSDELTTIGNARVRNLS